LLAKLAAKLVDDVAEVPLQSGQGAPCASSELREPEPELREPEPELKEPGWASD
jgi:hypothetical protein